VYLVESRGVFVVFYWLEICRIFVVEWKGDEEGIV
jgi:hypothetical protein